MNTFPHITYQTMRNTYEKCERIISLLESSLPIGKSVEGYISVKFKPASGYDHNSWWRVVASDFAAERTIVFPEVSKWSDKYRTITTKPTLHNYSEYTLTLDQAISALTESAKTNVEASFKKLKWIQEPQYAFHKSVYEQAKKAIKAMKSESDVNTLNISLASALKFLEELDEADLNEGIYQYDTDAVDDKVKKATENKVNELQRKYDAEYEKQLEEFKAKFNELMGDGAEGGKKGDDAKKEDHAIYNAIFDSHEPDKMESESNKFLNGFFTAVAVMLVAFVLYLLLK